MRIRFSPRGHGVVILRGPQRRVSLRSQHGGTHFMKRALFCGTAALALSTAAFAEGYVSGNYADLDGLDSWSLNGRYILGEHVMLDAGYSSLDADIDQMRVGGHVFWRGADWLLGAYVGGEWVDTLAGDANGWVVAGEGQFHTGRVTLAGTVSYAEMDTPVIVSFDQWTVNGTLRYFVTDNLSLEASAAWLDTTINPVALSSSGSYFGLGAEYQFHDCLSVFAGYRHTDLGDGTPEVDTWGIGLRWSFGEGTLMQRDRSGARLRRPEGVFETFSGGGSID